MARNSNLKPPVSQPYSPKGRVNAPESKKVKPSGGRRKVNVIRSKRTK